MVFKAARIWLDVSPEETNIIVVVEHRMNDLTNKIVNFVEMETTYTLYILLYSLVI